MVKKTHIIESKNSTFFLAFSHPDWFLPYREVTLFLQQILMVAMIVCAILGYNMPGHMLQF